MLPFFFFGFHNVANSGGITTDQNEGLLMIDSIKKLNNALKRISRDSVASVLLEAETFAVSQLKEHRNASPVSAIAVALSNISGRPYGLSRREYIAHYETMGLVWDKQKESFSIGKDADFAEAPVGYWIGMEKPQNESTDSEKAEKVFARIAKSELTYKQAVALLATAYKTNQKKAA